MKRAAAWLAAIALALSLTGCASIFDAEYFSSSKYESEPRETGSGGVVEIGSYLQLTLAINRLVSEHGESATLHFTAYDGDIAQDLAAACREVSTETALGNYAVDYISYDLDRIVAYYEAEVYVFYKRSAEELDAIVSVNTPVGLYNTICGMLASLETRLVATLGAASIDEQAVLDYVEEAYFADPMACVEKPEATVSVYTGSGYQRIVELSVSYGAAAGALEYRREALGETAARLLAGAVSENTAYRALQCANALVSRCRSDEGAPDTLWSAIMAGEASSEGMAVAYKALCDASGIECVVVAGRFDRAEHYWNIITVDGASYHVDVSRAGSLGFGSTFLMNDDQMWGSYWWDNQEYPVCDGPLSYAALVDTGPAEPQESPVQETAPVESAPVETAPGTPEVQA